MAFRRGSLTDAISFQMRAIASADAIPKDFLLLSLYLWADKKISGAIHVLKDGLLRYPGNAEIHENLGVCLVKNNELDAGIKSLTRALELGSKSANVLDALCHGLWNLGRHDEAVAYGRKSLEAKDKKFGARNSSVPGTIPEAPPPQFDMMKPAENVISYALWGDSPRYLIPLRENLRIQQHLYPGWSMWVYLDDSVPENYRRLLRSGGARLIVNKLNRNEAPARRLLWRFDVVHAPGVKRFLIRDADSLLTVKECVAVDEWTRSEKYFHVIRDAFSHTDLVLAGLWGGVGGILPPPNTLMKYFKRWRVEGDHIDQDLLTGTVWPTIKRSCLIHDSIYTGCLGSVPFPPFGELPKGRHIGENSFLYFTKSTS